MNIYIGADHNGFDLKEKVVAYLKARGYKIVDEGDKKRNPADDFPIFASRVVHAMRADKSENVRGILICGSGQGMVIAANRFKGIRAGLGYSETAARSTRNDEDSNILALPSDILEKDGRWQKIVDTWLITPFAGADRFKRRNRQLDEL